MLHVEDPSLAMANSDINWKGKLSESEQFNIESKESCDSQGMRFSSFSYDGLLWNSVGFKASEVSMLCS